MKNLRLCFVLLLLFGFFSTGAQAGWGRFKHFVLYPSAILCGVVIANPGLVTPTLPNKVVKKGQDGPVKRPLFTAAHPERRVFKLTTADELKPEVFAFDDRGKAVADKLGYAAMFNAQAKKEGIIIPEKDVLKLTLEEISFSLVNESTVRMSLKVAPYNFPFERDLDFQSFQRGDTILIPLQFERDRTIYKVVFAGEMRIKYEPDWGVIVISGTKGSIKVTAIGQRPREELFEVPEVVGK